ncbi:DUF58 domain-containing protein [Chondromyces apiculatus]|uniref:DUF58 domain-containing protein n=1 Tax=Chondromyces apiculatus DSM 436 TaxID=1192034 RepID=A0A017SVW5_9BACT|nr:DUF58 domain-containing protein [Chondromyces apiculatus]EYF00451.1 Hypothetical protein CAP_0820 [Chondromyces apiculatus DSM 436]
MVAEKPEPLLGPSFIRELEVLRRRLEIRARSGGGGEHLARRKGSSAEFQEHRAYAPGDDMRRIDWGAYARTGEPVLKLFRAEEDVIVRLVSDTSASLGVGEPSKLDAVRRLSAAIGYMALARSERAQLFLAGEGIAREMAPSRGRGGLAGLLRGLTGLTASGGTNLARAVDSVVQRSPRPGMLVALSDFFDPGPVTAALGRAVQAGHDVALVQVVAPEEMEPQMEGDWTLEDAETGALVEVTLDASAIEAYMQRFAGLCAELRAFARKHRATYVRARTDEPLEGVVRRFVARSVD